MTYEYEGKTEKEAIEKAAAELGLEKEQFDVEILEAQKNSLFKKGFVRIRVTPVDAPDASSAGQDNRMYEHAERVVGNPAPQDGFEKQLLEFVSTLIQKMGYEAQAEIVFREPHKIGVKLNSAYSSILIGRKGKNLDALQLLSNIYAGRLGREDIRVILDTENYRLRREESLVRLAYSTADKVRQTHSSILLEPMNPFERRLIHTALNEVPDITTESEGDGLYKQVCIMYKG